ncbi:hypothetical protein [Streptomyces sp. NPDC058664]|uniref:hypothetical protein n=1 Tax=unclassified Streptomyces TaxID=2593676 RepID=UPI00365BBC60
MFRYQSSEPVREAAVLVASVRGAARTTHPFFWSTDEALTFTRTASGTGTYYVEVEAYSGSGTATYTCTLTKS